jgi:hypothetical protein
MFTRSGAARLRGRLFITATLAVLPLFAHAQGGPPGQCPPQAIIQSSSQSVDEGVIVKLNGQPSKGTTPTYAWQRLSGASPIVFSPNASDSKPEFVAPEVTGDQQVVIELKVTACGGQSDTETITITIRDLDGPPPNTAPNAVASASPPTAGEGASVTLDGSASTDAETPASGLAYAWTQIGSGPAVTIQDANQATASFVAPNTATTGVTLEFQLRVTDPQGLHDDENVVVNIVFANDAPFASLSCPLQVDEGDTVLLDGSASSDYEDDFSGTPLTYAWSQTQGPPNIDVFTETGDTVSFTAPILGTGDLGGIDFELTVTDSGGLFTQATCGVFINDVTAPVFTGDEDRIVEATRPSGADVLDYGLTAVDNVEGDVSDDIECTPPEGSAFALDLPTQVDCSVEDANENTANTSFLVTVLDRTKPVIDPHGDVAKEAEGPAGAAVDYDAPGTFDVVDEDLVATCAPASGSTFAVGSTTVTCNATDASGNAANPTTFQVTVHDLTPPALTVPDPIIEEATGPGGATVTFTASAIDIVDGVVPVTCVPPTGSTFALGATTVNCSATDAAGNTANGSFTVTVQDTTPPSLQLPASFSKEATSAAGAAASFIVTASDIVDTDVEIACSPVSGSTFALGTTTVDCTATDDSGNATPGAFTVTVVDTTPPAIAPHADVDAIALSNSNAVVTYTNPTATDIVDGPVTVTCAPASGSTFQAGATAVTCTAEDARHNTATSTFNVNVTYAFGGFFRPVDNLPMANVVKAGQAIPVKFTLGGDQGLSIFTTGYPKAVAVSCGSAYQDAIEETVTAGNSTLTYDTGTQQYHYVWKTDKGWGGTCRQLQIKFRDGTTRTALFNFTR